jgi:hypothetical protein
VGDRGAPLGREVLGVEKFQGVAERARPSFDVLTL